MHKDALLRVIGGLLSRLLALSFGELPLELHYFGILRFDLLFEVRASLDQVRVVLTQLPYLLIVLTVVQFHHVLLLFRRHQSNLLLRGLFRRGHVDVT